MPAPKKPSDKAVPVRAVNSNAAMSPADLEAEIAATATAIGEAKTIQSKLYKAEEAATPPTQPEAASADDGDKIEVVVSKPRLDKAKEESAASEPEQTLGTEPQIVGHRQRTIQPIASDDEEPLGDDSVVVRKATAAEAVQVTEAAESAAGDGAIDTETTEVTAEASIESEEAEQVPVDQQAASATNMSDVADTGTEQQAPSEVAGDETAFKLNEMASALKNRGQQTDSEEQNAAKIYDTKKYHVPIKVNRHHRKAAVPLWAEILILLVGVFAAVAYAAYSDILDTSSLPFVSNNSSESNADKKSTVADTTPNQQQILALGSVDFQNKFNTGTARIQFERGEFTYDLPATFMISARGEVIVDFLTDAQSAQVDSELLENVKPLTYPATSIFDNTTKIEFLPNSGVVGLVTPTSLLGLSEAYTGASNDVSLEYAEDLFNTSEKCVAAVKSFRDSLDAARISESLVSQAVSASLRAYQAINPACQTATSKDALQTLAADDIATRKLSIEQTDKKVTVRATSDSLGNITIELSNFALQQNLEIPDIAATSPEFLANRVLDMALIGQCPADTFATYTAGATLPQLAKAQSCPVIE